MKLHIQIINQQINVTCQIHVQQADISFALASSLSITQFKNNEKIITPEIEDQCSLLFRPAMTKYQFHHLTDVIFSFHYHGSLDGYFLFMQENIYHFSYYNGWYPTDFDILEDYDIFLYHDDTYQLINGTYIPDQKCWYYTTKHQKSFKDCNIILVCQDTYHIENDGIQLYYFEPHYQVEMEKFIQKYAAIRQYYLQLYSRNAIEDTTIVFLPEKYQIGGYKRDHLIVFSELSQNIDEELHRLAHEMAHAYACGANTQSWEDWLNETHAEWSALLYELENEPELFQKSISRFLTHSLPPSLKPLDGHRPDDVHETGANIYYQIYLKFGIDNIKMLLQTFDCITTKDTQTFLKAVSLKNKNISQFIQSYIK